MSDSAQVRSTAWAAYYQAHEKRPVRLSSSVQSTLSSTTPPLFKPLISAVVLVVKHASCWRPAGTSSPWIAGRWSSNRFSVLRPPEHCSRLTAKVACFEELEALPSSALIHAGLSLPFCQPQRFAALWKQILSALEPGGVFVGQLFGDRDGWSSNPEMTFHTAGEVTVLLADLDIQVLHEFEEDGNSMQGPKHWHRFDIFATKPVRD